MTEDCHISSIVVHARSSALSAVTTSIAALAGTEIHAVDPSGKLVVLLTADSEARIAEQLRAINAIPGVLTALLVFHAVDGA